MTDTTLTDQDREALKEAAEKATPGLWLDPMALDHGETHHVILQSPELVHPDFNPLGIAEGVLWPVENGTRTANCPYWNNDYDCYTDNTSIRNITGVMPISRLVELTDDLNESEAAVWEYMDSTAALRAQLEAKDARIAELEGALEPLARTADAFSERDMASYLWAQNRNVGPPLRLSVKQAMHARALLQGSET